MVKIIIFIAALLFSLVSNAQNFIEDSILVKDELPPYIITRYMKTPIYKEKSKRFSYMEARDSILKDVDLDFYLGSAHRSIVIMGVFWVEENGSTSGHHIIYNDSTWHENLTFNPSLNELLLSRLKKLHFDKPAFKSVNQPVRCWFFMPLWMGKKEEEKK